VSEVPPPTLSPDGKFYWDGQKWQPMPAASPAVPTPVAAPKPRRRGCLWLGVAIIGVVIVAIVVGSHAGGSKADLKLDVQARSVTTSRVGGADGSTVVVHNLDTDISELVIFYADGNDNWADHHVVVSASSCTIDTGIKAFRCGPLKAGASMTIDIVSSPKDAGNFSYEFGFGDDASGGLRQWGQVTTFDEAVLP
jgi:hypothetical protein